MAATLYVFLAVAIGTLTIQAQVLQQCITQSWGIENGVRLDLPVVTLTSGIHDWRVNIPVNPTCVSVNGLIASICDVDSVPQARFLANNMLLVHRKGSVQFNGEVKVVQFCGV